MAFEGVEVWRGSVNAWETDEMGHLNVRYYVSIASQALAAFAAELGMPGAFTPAAGSTLLVREHHIRFLREAHVRAPLHCTAGVVEIGESEARLLFVLRHSQGGEVCATFNTLVAHVTAKEARPFAWPQAMLERAERLKIDLPAYAAPRSVPAGPVSRTVGLARADELSLLHTGAGAFRTQDCDVFGRMEAELFMGEIVKAIPHLGMGFRQTVVEHANPKPERAGNAALEHRLVYLDWPRAGDRFVMRSGFPAIDARGQSIIHWMLDPATGRPWGVCQAYIVTFDLAARKIIPVSDAAQRVLRERVTEGLGF